MPISSLYISKSKKDDNSNFSLLSNLHNLEIRKDFYCEKYEDINRFYSKFNKNKMFRDMKKDFYFKAKIGEGKFGQVILAERYSDQQLLAIKAVQKGYQSIEEYKINRWEIDIFKMLQNVIHPNVIKCIDLYEYECQIFFVYEFIESGDLRKISKELKLFPQYYTINTILKLSMQMIEGTKILHKYGVIHRDIKTTNMVIDIKSKSNYGKNSPKNLGLDYDLSNLGNGVLKIIDFGLSRILGKYEYSNDPYGSLCFKAPELIEHLPYDFKVDIWAIGITIYYLVYKELPYEKGSKEEIKFNIVHEDIPFHKNNFINNFNYYDGTNILDDINKNEIKSSILFSLMKDCLEKNPEYRPNIDQLSEKYTLIIKTIP
jgi:serine/threonine protein kinase